MVNPIFIIGCPRSGTTILGEFFDVSPYCQYFNEIDIWRNTFNPAKNELLQSFYGKILSVSRKNSGLNIFLRKIRILLNDFINFVKFEKSYDDINGHRLNENDVSDEIIKNAKSYLSKKYLVVKSTPNSLRIPFIKKIFPDSKFVHIIRDGRDVSCSLMNSPSGYFWSYIKPPEWKKIKKQYSGINRCAWQWKATIDIIRLDKENLKKDNFIEIQYENLINNPELIMKEVFFKLGIPFESSQFQVCKKVKNKVTSSTLAKNDRSTVLDHSIRVGRYKEELTKEELNQIEVILGYKS